MTRRMIERLNAPDPSELLAAEVAALRDKGPLTAQPRKQLTDEQIEGIRAQCVVTTPKEYQGPYGWAIRFARAIERACAEAWGVKLAGIGGEGKA